MKNYLPWLIFPVVPLLMLSSTTGTCGLPADGKLAVFQKFANGEVSIREAVVCRALFRTNGALSNREWWRFGCQNDSWFVQRLIPDAKDPAKLVPTDSPVCGASLRQFWVIGGKDIDLAAKDVAKGSLPDTFGGYYRSLMFGALSLGVPRDMSVLKIANARVNWDGLEFNTTVVSKRGQGDDVPATMPIKGQLKLGDNGLPASATFSGAGQFPGGSVTYEYSRDTQGIPKVFVITFPHSIFRYEFLSLTLGSNDLAKTDGYVPSLFADMKPSRIVTLWTNGLNYEQREGKSYPSFTQPEPKLGELAPKLQGTNWLNSANPFALDGLRGKVVLLDFWGINCPPCIAALPHSEALYKKFQNQGLIVIGVCGDWGSDKKAARILKDKNITFPNLMDADLAIADGKYGCTERAYVLDATPSYALIDKSWNLFWKTTLLKETAESQIMELLGSPQKQ